MIRKRTRQRKPHIEAYRLQDTKSQRKLSRQSEIWILLIGYLIMAGVAGVFACYLSDVRGVILLIAEAYVMLTLSVVLRDKPWMWGNGYAAYLIYLIMIIVNPLSFYRGMMAYLNQNIQLWNLRFGTHISLFSIQGVTTWNQIHFLMVLIMLAVMIVQANLVRRDVIVPTILLAVMITFISTFNLSVSFLWIAAAILGWVGIWTFDTAYKQRLLRKVYFFLILGVATVGIAYAVNGFYSNRMLNAREKTYDTIDDIRYGMDTLPQGDMSRASGLIGEDTTTLELSATSMQEMYMRGYVGLTFNGSKWDSINTDVYYNEYAGMISWLQSMDFSTNYQYAQYKSLTEESGADTTELGIRNISANRRYVYLPYTTKQLMSTRGTQSRYDWQVIGQGLFGASDYDIQVVDNDVASDALMQQAFVNSDTHTENYQEAENVYQTFVHDNYLTVDASEQDYIQQLFYSDTDVSESSISQITQLIRTTLQDNTIYSESPYAYDGSEDFVSWFMDREKLGNASYYATAAVLAYRVAGIPARYVEGYYLSAADAEAWNDSRTANVAGTYELTEKDAHAWAEIYIDGIGWMPVEVVPGFYYADYTIQQVIGTPQSSVNIQDNQTDNQLNGSTSDTLTKKNPNGQQGVDVVIQHIWYILGTILFTIFILWIIRMLVILQRRLRRKREQVVIARLGHREASRRFYSRVCGILLLDGKEIQEGYPYDNLDIFRESYGQITMNDYRRFCDMIQKAIFGEEELDDTEYQILVAFTTRLAEEVYGHLDKRRKFVMKYIRVYI